jgi:hypothetical protein
MRSWRVDAVGALVAWLGPSCPSRFLSQFMEFGVDKHTEPPQVISWQRGILWTSAIEPRQ